MSIEFDEELKDVGGGYLPPSPVVKFLYRIVVDCAPPITIGPVGGGVKRVIPIIGGRFEGPVLKGVVLPVGADWNTADIGDPGHRKVDTRYILKTDDGAHINLSTIGFSYRSPDILAKRESGERIDPSLYYFKQHLFFETASQSYDWLNTIVAFGIVMSKYKGGPGVIYDAYYLA